MSPGSLDRVGRSVRLVVQLRPAQLAHRARLRTQRAVLRAIGPHLAPLLEHDERAWRWPASMVTVDQQAAAGEHSMAEGNAEGRFCFLNEERALGDPADWEQATAAQLWRFHLHYFDWGCAFWTHPDRAWARAAYCSVTESWLGSTAFGRGDAWSPYVASVRAWNWCALYTDLVADTRIAGRVLRSLGLHARFIASHLERDLGGNHLLKNLKALIGLGVLLDRPDVVRKAVATFERQIRVQVLADGGHFELSPSYHCQVLGDMLDVRDLLAAGQLAAVDGLDEAIVKMRCWLGAMLMPDGDVPLFNDGALVGSTRLAIMQPSPTPMERVTFLDHSGYVVVRPDDRLHVVVDVGLPCPPTLPGHAHADCLSFELAVDGRRLIVDSGTSQYAPGKRRSYERSTAAHNTVEVDGRDQTEVWGSFRAGRRARPIVHTVADDDDGVLVDASHDGYRTCQASHRRAMRIGKGGVEIMDEIAGRGSHEAVARLHFAPGLEPIRRSAAEVDVGPLKITVPAECMLDRVLVADDFGSLREAWCLSQRVAGPLPVRLVTTIELVDGRPAKEAGRE